MNIALDLTDYDVILQSTTHGAKYAKVLDDASLREKMAQAGRQRIEKEFNITRNIRQIESIYAEAYQKAQAVVSIS